MIDAEEDDVLSAKRVEVHVEVFLLVWLESKGKAPENIDTV